MSHGKLNASFFFLIIFIYHYPLDTALELIQLVLDQGVHVTQVCKIN